jgi:hypothetical protein
VCAIRTPGGLSFPFQREHGGAGLGIWSVQVQCYQLEPQPSPPKLAPKRRDSSPFVGKRASTTRRHAKPGEASALLPQPNPL